MKSLKLISLGLALLMLVGAFASCGNSLEGNGTTADSGAATEPETDDIAQIALSQLDADWGGKEFTILYTNDIAGYSAEIFAEGYATGDTTTSAVINDAVFERNTLFADRCHLSLNLVGRGSGEVMNLMRTEASNASGDYQLFTETTSATASLATSCALYNYLALDDVDYEAPWWDAGTLEFALNGKVFFMNGAHNIVDDDVTFVMMFNKKLATNYQVPSPYDTVRAGDWTLDYFNRLIQGVSNDSNGDGKMDENDTYGFVSPNSIGNTFFYGCGLQYVRNSRDMDVPELVLNEGLLNKATEVLTLAREIIHGNNAAYVAPAGKEGLPMTAFKQDRALFYCEAASYLGGLNKEMDGDYGVVPIPKYEKSQENYLTWTHSIGSTLSMPASLQDPEAMGPILETFVILSYQKVKPAYYDTMLTKRSIRDAESAEMLDIIFRNRVYDMAMYFTDLGFCELFSEAARNTSGNFASSYAKASKNFDKRIKTIMKSLDKMDNH